MTEVKNCPLCGSVGISLYNGTVRCSNIKCYFGKAGGRMPSISEWNKRPIEDRLMESIRTAVEFIKKQALKYGELYDIDLETGKVRCSGGIVAESRDK